MVNVKFPYPPKVRASSLMQPTESGARGFSSLCAGFLFVPGKHITHARHGTRHVCKKMKKIDRRIEKSCTFAANMKNVQSQHGKQRVSPSFLTDGVFSFTPPVV